MGAFINDATQFWPKINPPPTVDYLEQFCAISKFPMVLIEGYIERVWIKQTN